MEEVHASTDRFPRTKVLATAFLILPEKVITEWRNIREFVRAVNVIVKRKDQREKYSEKELTVTLATLIAWKQANTAQGLTLVKQA